MSRKLPPTLGQEVREARLAAGLTQAELAKRAKLPRGQVEISEIERGKLGKAAKVIDAIRRVLRMT